MERQHAEQAPSINAAPINITLDAQPQPRNRATLDAISAEPDRATVRSPLTSPGTVVPRAAAKETRRHALRVRAAQNKRDIAAKQRDRSRRLVRGVLQYPPTCPSLSTHARTTTRQENLQPNYAARRRIRGTLILELGARRYLIPRGWATRTRARNTRRDREPRSDANSTDAKSRSTNAARKTRAKH